MAKKLESNGLWESSRMMLPEHKEQIHAWRRRRERRSRPELDEQEWERIDAALNWSLRTRKPVRIRLYDPYEERVIIGAVERVDRLLRRVRVDGEWFAIGDIIGAEYWPIWLYLLCWSWPEAPAQKIPRMRKHRCGGFLRTQISPRLKWKNMI